MIQPVGQLSSVRAVLWFKAEIGLQRYQHVSARSSTTTLSMWIILGRDNSIWVYWMKYVLIALMMVAVVGITLVSVMLFRATQAFPVHTAF